jgi:predicted ribosome quality control (RQC) complex YloA/Tae2 family protein
MKPIEIPGITLHAWTREWNEKWKDSFIQQFREVGENQFVLRTHARDKTGEWWIHFPNVALETGRKWTPSKEQPGVVKQSKLLLENQKIKTITQNEIDRIIIFELEEGKIILELFGDGNWVSLDADGKIKAILHAREWRTRTLKQGETYQFPPGPKAWNELPEKLPEWGGKTRTLGGWMVTHLGIPPIWASTIAHEIKRKPEDTQPLTQREWKKLREQLQELWKKKATNYFLLENEEREWVLPDVGIESEGKIIQEGTAEEIQKKVEEKIINTPKVEAKDEKREKERQALTINIERQRKMQEGWNEKIKELQKSGEWVYAHYDMVEKLIQTVQRAKTKKISSHEVTQKIKEKIPAVKKVDAEKGLIELEIE